jgi:hypothetical protein
MNGVPVLSPRALQTFLIVTSPQWHLADALPPWPAVLERIRQDRFPDSYRHLSSAAHVGDIDYPVIPQEVSELLVARREKGRELHGVH